jgi:hypothetical protein
MTCDDFRAPTRPPAALPRRPQRLFVRCDATVSVAFCTSTCRSHDVTEFSAPTPRAPADTAPHDTAPDDTPPDDTARKAVAVSASLHRNPPAAPPSSAPPGPAPQPPLRSRPDCPTTDSR